MRHHSLHSRGRSLALISLGTVACLLIATVSAAVTYPVVDTGQVIFYDDLDEVTEPALGEAFYGQDAHYEGNQPSYTLSGDGLTVYDNVTGLTWAASADTDLDGVLESPGDKLSWDDALDFPATLNAVSYGGYNDWRVPTIKELYSLILFSGEDPSGYSGSTSDIVPFIDTDYFEFVHGNEAQMERIIDSQYWSSNEYVDGSGEQLVFGVNFADGRIKGYGTSFMGGDKVSFIQCVRGNTDYGVNDFTDNGNDTVTDTTTGLMWQQGDSGEGVSWEEALAYAETLDLGGHDDWRLPNAKELQSIVDYSRSPGTSSSAAIDPMFTCTGITNETLASDYPWYWGGTTHANLGEVPGGHATYVCFGRGMGYMFGWADVHGAGCQRSDPKAGDLSDFTYVPYGYYFGDAPQGDAIRIDNYVRCVRDAADTGAVEPQTTTSSLRWSPNPFRGESAMMFTAPLGTESASCEIFDASGRLVRSLTADADAQGLVAFAWDGTTSHGEEVATGVFFARIAAGEDTYETRVVMLK